MKTVEKLNNWVRIQIDIEPRLLSEDDYADICDALGEGLANALKRLGLLLSEDDKQ
jgi:hypothetical protein